MPPSDTNARHQRESRQVPFDADAGLWAAIKEGIVFSSDLDQRGNLAPPVRCASPTLPPAPAAPVAPPAPPVSGARTPMSNIDRNVLGRDIQVLEREIAKLRRRVALQDNVINGLCNLHVHEHEKPPHPA